MWGSWLCLASRPLCPLFERLLSRVQHVEPSATCLCNVCARMGACHCVPSPSLGSPALVTPRSVSSSPPPSPTSWVSPALLGEEGGDCRREHRVLSRAPAGAAPPALSLHNPPRTLPAQMPACHDSRGQNRTLLFLTFLSRAPRALCPEF